MEHDEGNLRSLLQEKTEELMRTKEELNRAKDQTTQSWLDSRPLIDELERLKLELENAEKQPSMTCLAVSELESELQAMNKAIGAKKEEELEASKKINETTLAIDRTRDELEELKAKKHKEHRARSRLKQTLRLRKQTLRSLQLGLRAVRIESEAVGASAAKALYYINQSETDHTVQLKEEEYYDMQRREKEESSLANWRISVAEEQKLAAEGSRKKVILRLKETNSKKRSRRVKEKGLEDEETEGVKEKGFRDEGTEGKKGFRGVKEKRLEDEETKGEKVSKGVRQKELADEDTESEKGSRRLQEGVVDEETAESRDLSSQEKEPVSNRPYASAKTPAHMINGSNGRRLPQASRSSSRRFTNRNNSSILRKIKTHCGSITRMLGISNKPCHRAQTKETHAPNV